MIFKTWLTDLTKIQGVVNNIKSIELWANGATGLLNPSVVNSLSSATKGLNLQQAQLALSTRNLTQEQMNQVLVQAGLIASENKIKAELLQSALVQAGLSAEKQKAILIDLNLMNATTGEIYTTKACTKEKLLNMLATKGVTGANVEAILSILGLAGGNGVATISFKLLTASIWANIKALAKWLVTNPVGWCVLAIGAIFGLVKVVDALTVSFDEAVEKTKSSKQELDQLTSEISDLNKELETTKDRIDELLEKANSGSISLLEEEELNKLKEQNDELQREIALKEKMAEIDAKEAAKNAAYSLTYETDDDIWDEEYNPSDRIEKLQGWINEANWYKEKLSEANQQIRNIEESATDDSYKTDAEYKKFVDIQKNSQKKIEKAETEINTLYEELSVEDDGLYYNGKVVEGYEGLAERLNNVYSELELYFNDGNIADITEKYIDTIKNKLIESGLSEDVSKVVVESFSEADLNSIMSSDSIDWSQCLGLDDATAVIENIKGQLNSISDANKNPISLFDQITNSAESLDKFQSSVKSAADAYATLLSGNYSSTELLDSIQAINQAATDMGESINWEEIDSLDMLGDKLEEVSQKYLESIADIDVDSGFGKMLANIIQAQKASTQLEVLNGQIDSLQSAYSDLTDVVDSYNNTGRITFDQLQKLLEMEPQYLACLVDENGQLQLNETAMTALANQRLDDAEAQAIQQAITELGMLAMQDEESAVKENAQAFNNAINDLAGYNEELANTIAETGVATSLIRDLDAALQDAESDGATDDQIDTVLNNLKTKLQLIGNVRKQINNNGLDSVFGSAGKDAAKSFTDALDKELAALDKKMEAGYIDFNDYIQARISLIEDYYNQGKLSADEYYSYLEKHYDTQLSYMDKAVNAVTRRIDTELDALKQQKEDVEDIYKVQIESLEKEKTLLEEANKERQRQIDLQKSLYDLERARNQRTKLVYSEDKGMHYVADDQSIRDAQEDVDNARYDIKISEIEKTISNLEEARDKQTDAIDEMISDLEAYKDAWKDITSAYEEEQEELIAAQMLGANWENEILNGKNGRLDVLNAFKNEYINIQQAMVDAAWKSANEQVKAAKEAEKGSSGSTNNKAPKIDGKKDLPQLPKTSSGGGGGGLGGNKLTYTNITAYASGTNNAKKGLNLVGEDGTETYFDNHGHVAIVTKPTLIPMEGGEVVKSERDTKKLLDPDNLAPADTIGLADIDGKEAEYTIKVNVETNGEIPDTKSDSLTRDETITLSDGTVLTPIQPDSFMWNLQEKFNTYINKMGEDISSAIAPIASIQKDMERMVNNANTVNNITNSGMRQITIGDIHVTCPGVTEQQVAERLGNVIGKELNRQFNGFSLIALQESKK